VRLTYDLRRTTEDLLLRRRFQHQRGLLLTSLGETFDEWRARLVEARPEGLQHTKRQRLLEAETRLETALTEFKAARHRWTEARRLRSESRDHRQRLQAEFEKLRQALRAARASVRASMLEWEMLCREYLAVHNAAAV
jgi:exonuclease VII large subunit